MARRRERMAMDMAIEVDIGARIGTIADGTTTVGTGAGNTVVTETTTDKYGLHSRRFSLLLAASALPKVPRGRRSLRRSWRIVKGVALPAVISLSASLRCRHMASIEDSVASHGMDAST
jgi:hypothetical protein